MNMAQWTPRRRLVFGCLLGLVVAAAVYLLHVCAALERLELQLYDLRFRLRGPRFAPEKGRIVIVAVDAKTLEAARQADVRQVPLDRRVYAQAIVNISEAGAALICMDVLFSSHRAKEEDEALVSAVSDAGIVVLACTVSQGEWVEPFEALRAEDAMVDQAHVMVGTDPDEILRRLDKPAIQNVNADGQLVSVLSLGLAAVLYYEPQADAESQQTPSTQPGSPTTQNDASDGDDADGESGGQAGDQDPDDGDQAEPFRVFADRIELDGRTIPLPFYVNFIGPSHRYASDKTLGFKVVSLWDVAAGGVPKRVFADKIVLIGSTIYGEDDFATPYSTTWFEEMHLQGGVVGRVKRQEIMPGVECHANIINNILDGRYIRCMQDHVGRVGMAVVLAGVAVAAVLVFFSLRFGLWVKLPAFIIGLAALAAWAYGAFVWRDYVVAVVPLAATWCAQFVTGTLYQVLFLRQRNAQVRRVFGRYVSPDVLKKILVNPEAMHVIEEKEVSVLFSDIRSFTSMSEGMEPGAIIALLNEYFDYMVQAIFGARGSVDKFVGDEIMAVFGAPFPLEDHAKWAVRAGMAMQECVREFDRSRQQRGLNTIQMGVGIHSGPVVAGTVGARQRVEYSVIGDTVNTAARIESQTKGFQVLISRVTYEAVRDIVEVVALEPVKVKGKAEPVEIFEVRSVIDGSLQPLMDVVRQGLTGHA